MSKKQSLISRRQMLKTTGAAVLGLGAFNILGSRAATLSASTSGTLTLLASGDLLALASGSPGPRPGVCRSLGEERYRGRRQRAALPAV
jgi:hypothetical protein